MVNNIFKLVQYGCPIMQVTYDGEFIESLEELRGEVNVLRSDVGVDEIDKLCCLSNDVERLEVVWLLSQVVLSQPFSVTIAFQQL